MRHPKDLELSGLQRLASLASPIGRIELRSTESERLFGKTPERATIEAANAVAKALKQSSFPSNVKNLNLNWQIVFLSKELKQGQVPENFLLSNCHPGWMTPPANIYIASEQAAGACGSQSAMTAKVADAQLARVLTHELGHSVKYALAPYAARDRARSEGFATWFQFFGQFSNLLDSNLILSEQKLFARQRASIPNQSFQGGAGDYALASVLFHLLNENRSVADLSRVYDLMTSSHISFLQSFTKSYWLVRSSATKRINSF